MGTRYLLVLLLVLLVLGFGECGRPGRRVCEGDEMSPQHLPSPVLTWPYPSPSVLASLSPATCSSALLTHSTPAEVQGAHESQQDETTSSALLTQMQESLYSYWGTARSAAEDLYKKAYPTTMDEKIRDIYSKSTAAVSTYAGIFTDQLLSMLKGDS
uniref:Apolipoprotein C-II n=1 Tax=Canis lupus familiaris TaxID=9615 RepID=A0A8C0LY94_CANLF